MYVANHSAIGWAESISKCEKQMNEEQRQMKNNNKMKIKNEMKIQK